MTAMNVVSLVDGVFVGSVFADSLVILLAASPVCMALKHRWGIFCISEFLAYMKRGRSH